MKHMSLCTGYGGIDMALESVFGAETVAVADIDPGACKILAHHYPNVPNLGDITATDWSQWVGKVDVISGGTPCQDLSHAGRRAGMTEGTRSNLWVAMREAVATIRPALVVWENVRGAYSAAADSELESCPGCMGDARDRGPSLRALGRVLGDLSSLGYDACWYGLRASDVGAAHHRFRVFVFAFPAGSDAISGGLDGRASDAQRGSQLGTAAAGSGEVPSRVMPTPTAERDGNTPETHLARKPGRKVVTSLDVVAAHLLPSPRTSDTNGAGEHGDGGPDLRTAVTHSLPTPRAYEGGGNGDVEADRHSPGLQCVQYHFPAQDWREYEPAIRRQEQAFGRSAPLPTEPGRTGKPRLSARFSEWLMGCPDGWITDTPGITRNEALKAAGNGVVPAQCAAAARRFVSDFTHLAQEAS